MLFRDSVSLLQGDAGCFVTMSLYCRVMQAVSWLCLVTLSLYCRVMQAVSWLCLFIAGGCRLFRDSVSLLQVMQAVSWLCLFIAGWCRLFRDSVSLLQGDAGCFVTLSLYCRWCRLFRDSVSLLQGDAGCCCAGPAAATHSQRGLHGPGLLNITPTNESRGFLELTNGRSSTCSRDLK